MEMNGALGLFGAEAVRIPNCHVDLRRFHLSRVALSQKAIDELRTRRNVVRKVIARRLRAEGHALPRYFRGQGSIAMGTAIRNSASADYDIDDGIYFLRRSLIGPRGGELSALAARERIWEAAHRENYADEPEIRTNCVRIFYARGFRVDVPVYRITPHPFGPSLVEIASTDWRRTDPVAVTSWFRAANARSPELIGSRQLTRLVGYVKAWSRSRASWEERTLSGFAITKLVVDQYRRRAGRDDIALIATLEAMARQLHSSTAIAHPVLDGEWISAPGRDARARYFRDCLDAGLAILRAMTVSRDRSEALPYWNRFFYEDFFTSPPRIQLI